MAASAEQGSAEVQAKTARRVFVHIAGYYPLPPEINRRRFEREYARSLKAWSLTGSFGAMSEADAFSAWDVSTQGSGWASEVEHILFRWDDIIEADRDRNWFQRIGLGLWTFGDFVINGALFRYFRHAWRYAGFFLYPFVLLALLFTASYFAAGFGLRSVGSAQAIVQWGAATLLFFALLHIVGVPLKLDHLLDDWIYGRSIVRRFDPAVEERLAVLADKLNADAREVLIVGHSFGAVYGARLVEMMSTRQPHGKPIRFASVGASILKIGFNGAARPLHQSVQTIASSPRVIWHDFTALNDVMNFHMIEPVSALGVAGKPAYTRKVRFRGMVAPEYYAKMERNFFRLHNQFISGNDFRASYDYFMLMCGPWAMEAQSLSPDGIMSWIDENGALTDQGKAIAQTGANA